MLNQAKTKLQQLNSNEAIDVGYHSNLKLYDHIPIS